MKKSILCLALISLLLSSCSAIIPEPIPVEPPRPMDITAIPTPDKIIPEPGLSFQVVDALDRSVTFTQAPQRIVVTGRASLMILDALYAFPEAGQRVVAYEAITQGSADFITLLDPGYSEKAKLIRDAGVEQIVVAKPDLVLMKSSQAAEFGAPLEALQIPVVYVDFETPEQYARDLAILGTLFQNQARAVELINYYSEERLSIQGSIKQLSQNPSVLMLYYNERDGAVAFNVPPMAWMQTRIVEMAGGSPVWDNANLGSGWTTVSFEQVAAWDADVILLISYNKDPGQVVDMLKQDLQWQALRAVQSGQLLAFPTDYYSWDQPDTRWILGLTWLAKRLYPQQFAQVDLQLEAQQFYAFLYGLDSDAFEASIVPMFKGDIP